MHSWSSSQFTLARPHWQFHRVLSIASKICEKQSSMTGQAEPHKGRTKFLFHALVSRCTPTHPTPRVSQWRCFLPKRYSYPVIQIPAKKSSVGKHIKSELWRIARVISVKFWLPTVPKKVCLFSLFSRLHHQGSCFQVFPFAFVVNTLRLVFLEVFPIKNHLGLEKPTHFKVSKWCSLKTPWFFSSSKLENYFPDLLQRLADSKNRREKTILNWKRLTSWLSRNSGGVSSSKSAVSKAGFWHSSRSFFKLSGPRWT